jgi:Na+:H+ antiporter, NhaA family
MKPLLKPLEQFLQSEAKGGIILFCAALLAFIIANSPLSAWYDSLKDLAVSLKVGDWTLDKSLSSWVKDLLMSFFFLLVGLEIKRELLVGELANFRRALLTIIAALGGMLLPALVFSFFNAGTPGSRGWGVPMATDIAFALGVLLLLGKRVPLGLKIFLTAFAIVDDLGAILVIALFYSAHLQLGALLWAAAFFALAVILGRLRVTKLTLYMLVGAFMWYFTLKSGISPTIAAVLLASALPMSRKLELPDFKKSLGDTAKKDPEQLEAELEQVEHQLEAAQSPLHRLEHLLHPWATYFILPVFAFVNAGVKLSGIEFGPVALGAFLGLLIGKPLGVFLFCWLALRLKLAALPEGVNWTMLLGAGFLGGIGFTMSLFVAALAFPDAALLEQAKLGVLAASVVAAIIGSLVVMRGCAKLAA